MKRTHDNGFPSRDAIVAFIRAHPGKIGTKEIQLGRTTLSHAQNGHRKHFLECMKTRSQPFAHAEAGHRTASICHLTNIAMTVGGTLKLDPTKEQFVGNDEANKLLRPVFRSPWTL